MKGTLFTLAGLAGTKEGEGGDQEETVEEHGWGWEHQPMLPEGQGSSRKGQQLLRSSTQAGRDSWHAQRTR